MPITSLPAAPSRNEPATFSTRADALLGALATFVTEANALQTDVNTKQGTASTAATTATTKAAEALASADAAAATVNEVNEVIVRLSENENRVDIFTNQDGYYSTNETVPRQVETLPSFIARVDDEFNAKMLTLGYDFTLGTYAAGKVFTTRDMVILYSAEYYKVKANTSLPFTTTGTWGTDSTSLVAVGDATLRQTLASDEGSSLIGYLPAGTGAVATDVQSKLRESVSVKDFGAVGDGVTDDTAAVDVAFTSCGTTAQKLYVPAGTYLLSNTITWAITNGFEVECEVGAIFKATASLPVDNKLFLPSASSGSQKFVWRGGTLDGRLMPARVSGAPDLLYIATPNIKNVSIEGVTFICNDTRSGTAGDSCLFLAEGEDYNITGCTFQGASDAAIYTSGNQSQTLGQRCIVSNNFFIECNVGYVAKRLFINQIIECNILHRCTSGIVVGGEADTTLRPGAKTIISNNLLFRPTLVGIEARIANGSVITGNRIEDYGIDASDAAVVGYGVLIQGSSHCVVSGNSVSFSNTFTPHASSAAIYVLQRIYDSVTYPAQNNLLQGNVIRKCATAIMEGTGADINIIADNAIIEQTTRFTIVGANTILRDMDAVNPRLHTRYGASGATPTAGVHELIENDTGHLAQVLVPNDSSWQLLMGDAANPAIARMAYAHSEDRWSWRAGGSGVVFDIDSLGPRFGTRVATADAPITGYIEIRDLNNVVRRLAVIS